MKATCDNLLKAFRLHGSWIAVLLLCQCQMPTREAWQYIRSNGLLTYWGGAAHRPSPPFGAAGATSQRYAYSRSSYQIPRYGSSRYSYPSAHTAMRNPYLVPSAPSSRYYAAPAPFSSSPGTDERVGPARPAPRPRPRSEPPAVTRIPVEEPNATPSLVRKEPPATTPAPGVASKSNTTAPTQPAPDNDLPYGTSIPGRPNMVNSPYAGKTQLVDISGMTAGQTVKCPYTGKLFKVPSSQQATNNATSKIDTPKMSSEPKAEDKKP